MSAARRGAISAPAVAKNGELVAWARTLLSVVAGLVAGICGLTGAAGFAFYAAAHALTSLALLARLRCAPGDFFPETSALGFLAAGAFDNLFLFIVLWALGFGALWVF